MELVFAKLKEILSPEILAGKHIVFVGLGNIYRGDDFVGCYIVERLKEKVDKKNFYFLNVGEVVENYINKILVIKPEYIFFVDALRTNNETEDVLLLTPQQVQNYTFSTHNISLSTIIDFIKLRAEEEFNFNPKIYIIAVKTVTTKLSEGLSEQTKSVADRFVEKFTNFIAADIVGCE